MVRRPGVEDRRPCLEVIGPFLDRLNPEDLEIIRRIWTEETIRLVLLILSISIKIRQMTR